MRSIFPISSYRSASVNSRVYTSFVIILYKIHTEFHSRGIARRAPTAFANLPSMLCFVKTTPTITHTRPRATTYRWRRCGWYWFYGMTKDSLVPCTPGCSSTRALQMGLPKTSARKCHETRSLFGIKNGHSFVRGVCVCGACDMVNPSVVQLQHFIFLTAWALAAAAVHLISSTCLSFQTVFKTIPLTF